MTKATLVLGAILIATIGAPVGAQQTVIHGCVKKMTGALRVVSTAGSCLVGETPVDWNVQGPQGLQRGHGASGLQLVDAVGTVVGEWTTGAAGAGFDSAVSWTEGSDRVAMLLTSRDMWTVAGTPTFL